MEKQNNHEYGETDPDIIDQNTLVDGNNIQSEDQIQQTPSVEIKTEFGETDPDFIDQHTLVDNDNYARDQAPYQYKEEFIEDFKQPENDLETDWNVKSEDKEQITNKDNVAASDEDKNDFNKDKE